MKYNILITEQAERDMNHTADCIRSTLLNPAAAHALLVQTREVLSSLSLSFPCGISWQMTRFSLRGVFAL
ncbi:MAG: hypothetical protein LUD84_00415 [Clostridiales bacterium]|nr:hypothetical protein [Clostridiales bacterium]